ncbi:Putative glycosyltransferase EpsD [Planctomyces sp. SH-PL14]|nr:Putative glycosyltransferase EpsD [Planctomyces sp. SH-PL14]
MSLLMPTALLTHPTSTTRTEAGGATHRRLNVCHVSMSLLTGGLERLLVEFGKFHDSARYNLRFVALTELGPPAEDLRKLGFQVDAMCLARNGKRAAYRRLKEILVDEQIDIIHTHNTCPQFYGAFAAWQTKIPCILNTQHGRGSGPRLKDQTMFMIANRFTRRVVGVSNDSARLCQEQDRGSAHKIIAIQNGIDSTRFAYTGPTDANVAISVARLSPEKDFPTLLRATKLTAQSVPDFRLRLVGDGAERKGLETLSRELGIADRVEFLGERSDIPSLLAQAGFYVSSSKTEGISLTVLEAMAVGLPVVTTAVGGNPEIVAEGTTGHLVPPQNPEALAQAIVEMCGKRSTWNGMGRAARERIEQQFEIRTMIRQYERLYEELLGVRS